MPAPTLSDLDRCPHGRHYGDTCAGHAGPGVFAGGCHGGTSLGNPWPMTGGDDRIGTTVHGDPIMTGDVPTEGRPAWMRSRFHAHPDDWRPVTWPPPGPYWCSGHGDGYSIVIAWHRPDQTITTWWPEATDIDTTEHDELTFWDRFPRPEWWSGMEEKG